MKKEDPVNNPESKKGAVHTEKLKQDNIKPTSSPLLSSQPQKQKRILVIDDSPDIVFSLRIGLESEPTMQVFGFDNPVTALVEFKPNFYDLLLIDIKMPITAEQLLRRIKAELE